MSTEDNIRAALDRGRWNVDAETEAKARHTEIEAALSKAIIEAEAGAEFAARKADRLWDDYRRRFVMKPETKWALKGTNAWVVMLLAVAAGMGLILAYGELLR